MFTATARFAPRSAGIFRRAISSLPNNSHIKVFNEPSTPGSHILTYLETSPPSKRLAIGTSTAASPTPQSFTENRNFLKILDEVVAEHGAQDEDVISQARAYASPGGLNLGSAGGAGSHGGAGGAGRGGWVHLSDRRNPPDFGRIAWPEDILGSVEVDQAGEVVGKLQPSGTYRILTNEGILGISPFLRGKLVERLKAEEAKEHKA